MIQRLGASSLSFGSSDISSVRSAYDAKVEKNSNTAQKQADMVLGSVASQVKNQIPMQGKGQKLDIIA